MKNNKQLIRIEIPIDTTDRMKKHKWINNAVWIIADVITWMQEDINKWLWKENNRRKK